MTAGRKITKGVDIVNYAECKELFLTYIKSYCAAETLNYYETNFHIFEKYLCTIHFSGTSDFLLFRRSDFIGYVAYLRSKSIKNTSVRTYCRAVRAFLKFLYYEGVFPEDITQRVKYPKIDKAVIIPLTNARVARLENGIRTCSMSARNLLILHLCLDCGLRCSEVCNLKLSDIDFQNNFIKICNTKNNKSRILPLPVLVGDFIREYLHYRKSDCPYLIQNRFGSQMTSNAVKQMFSKLKKYDKDIHAHLCRHTFATSYIMCGGSLEILRVLMGHESYNVTKDYLHIATQMNLLNYDIYRLDDCMYQFFMPGRK